MNANRPTAEITAPFSGQLLERGYLITRELADFRAEAVGRGAARTWLLKIPAALACYWLGRSEPEAAEQSEA